MIVNPSPDTLLLPGDVLLLMGSREQVEAGLRYLQERMQEPRPVPLSEAGLAATQRHAIDEGSPWAGRTLAELGLRRATGAHVVGIQKGEQTITNPGLDVVLEPGNSLILFGVADQLEAATKYLADGRL
jgi:K+/H+ antiporter YhaU regulatory subunit KhtT